ncbi:MAG: 2-iminoacetate synthase ThiH [Peptococcaceae bacterium]|nr:2-iminoacetate synthase ThiH [Peptococcaceae bacterium]
MIAETWDVMTYRDGMDQLDPSTLNTVLAESRAYDPDAYTAADVERALASDDCSLEDFKALLSPAAEPYLEEIAAKAQAITRARFGNSVCLFTPLYIANYCDNGCVYCGFNCSNHIKRGALSHDELIRELDTIAATGLEDILILTGESERMSNVQWIGEAIKLAAERFTTVGIEIYPANVADYKYLHECGADFVTVFQETYDPAKYAEVHLRGNKRSLPYRFYAQERALMGGFRGAGFGALLGLSDNFRKDAFATGLHIELTQQKFPEADLAISVPRIRPFVNEDETNVKEQLSDAVHETQLLQIMCAQRIYHPQLSMTISTREREGFRDAAVGICATKISAGVHTDVGGHTEAQANEAETDAQFDINDPRSVSQVHAALLAHGLQPVYSDFIHVD